MFSEESERFHSSYQNSFVFLLCFGFVCFEVNSLSTTWKFSTPKIQNKLEPEQIRTARIPPVGFTGGGRNIQSRQTCIYTCVLILQEEGPNLQVRFLLFCLPAAELSQTYIGTFLKEGLNTSRKSQFLLDSLCSPMVLKKSPSALQTSLIKKKSNHCSRWKGHFLPSSLHLHTHTGVHAATLQTGSRSWFSFKWVFFQRISFPGWFTGWLDPCLSA